MTSHAPEPPRPKLATARRFNLFVDESPYGDWGGWKLDTETASLFIETPEIPLYEISLSSCRSAVAFLNWIAHLNEKSWVTAGILGGFVAAVDDIIRVRAYGNGHPLTTDEIFRRMSAAASRYPVVSGA